MAPKILSSSAPGTVEPLGPFIEKYTFGDSIYYYFWCPGCQEAHSPNHTWQFNQNVEKPTFHPSILVQGKDDSGGQKRCHSFVRDGQIQFLGDCTHELRGKTVPMEPIDF